ncbi:MAG: SIMPL domain-containing protein [Hirschia sp.]|nr:SIMPL domain-containing protein [Hirschia sp.]MBF17304.1 SIMPL domain-containing protein [Hirschia sp.]
MKRHTSLLAIAAISCIGCAASPLPVQAQQVSPMMESPTIQQETTMSLTGEGSVKATPDIATISLGVSIDAETASAAMKQQASHMSGVFAAMEKAGIASKDMQTGNISLSPRYDYSSKRTEPPKLTGYNASNTVTVVIRDLEKLGPVLDSVVEAGGNTINSINLGVDDDTEIMKEVRKKAVQDAMSKAELYAEAAGYRVSRIVTLDEQSSGYPPPRPMMARMEMASDSASTPVAAGEITFTSSVSVLFELTR